MKSKLNFTAKTLLIKAFAVLVVIGMMDSAAFSQTKRIRFARGKTSTTLKGEVYRFDGDSYVINGKRGQTMVVRLISPTT